MSPPVSISSHQYSTEGSTGAPTETTRLLASSPSSSSTLHQPKPPCQDEPYSVFDKRQKVLIVAIASAAASFSGFSANIYFPAIPAIADDLDVSIELVNLTVTSYLIFQGLAPNLWGPISDVSGRRVGFCCTFLIFCCACIGLANTRNYATLLAVRCLQSTGSSSTIAIGSGVIGDITTREERGGYMGVFQAALVVPIVASPIIGGALADSFGWRSIFWFLAIYSGIFLMILFLSLPETLRSIVGNGGREPTSWMARFPLWFYQKTTRTRWDRKAPAPQHATTKHIDLTGPFRILTNKIAAPIIVFLAIHYSVWMMSVASMSTLFRQRYGLSETRIGLCFIANASGAMIGTIVTGKVLDRDYGRAKAKYDAYFDNNEAIDDEACSTHKPSEGFPLEQARLRLLPIFCLMQCFSIGVFGWTVQYAHRVPVGFPIATTFITGCTSISMQLVVITYLVDSFPGNSAASGASVNLARCLLAAGGTSVVMPMIDTIGVGWAFTIFVGIQVFALLLPVMQMRYAGRWRREAKEMEGQRGQTEDEQL